MRLGAIVGLDSYVSRSPEELILGAYDEEAGTPFASIHSAGDESAQLREVGDESRAGFR